MNKKLPIETFEQWLASPKGQSVHKSIISQSAVKNQVYIKNCLWWAFNAGQQSKDIQTTDAGEVLRELYDVKYRRRMPVYVWDKIRRVVDEYNETSNSIK